MVKVVYCDRCGKELERVDKALASTGFDNDIFENFDEHFENVNIEFEGKKSRGKMPAKVIKPQLCQDCLIGYNNIIHKTNESIQEYLKEGKSGISEKKKKKFGLF